MESNREMHIFSFSTIKIKTIFERNTYPSPGSGLSSAFVKFEIEVGPRSISMFKITNIMYVLLCFLVFQPIHFKTSERLWCVM